jgi:probable F420-dependent oxidoreductase
VTDEHIGPAEIGVAVEERGFESLFIAEHSHVPKSVATEYGPRTVPHDFARGLEQFVTLAILASSTSRIRIGTAVTLIPQRDPIYLAKSSASVDHISGGRFELGAGLGWFREELWNHGINPAGRARQFEERLDAVRRIWRDDAAEYHGRFVDFDPILSWPKPVQQPGPPLWIGGSGIRVLERVVRLEAGWLAPTGLPVDPLRAAMTELAAVAERRAHPGPVPVTATVFDPTPRALDELAELGVHRTLIALTPVRPRDETLAALDRYAEVAEAVQR